MGQHEILDCRALADTDIPVDALPSTPLGIIPAQGQGFLCRSVSITDGLNLYLQDFELYGEGTVWLGRDPLDTSTVLFYNTLSGVQCLSESWPGSANLSSISRVELCECPTKTMKIMRAQPVRTIAIAVEADVLGQICGLGKEELFDVVQQIGKTLKRRSAAHPAMSLDVELQMAASQAFRAANLFPDDLLYLKAKALEILSLHLRQMRAFTDSRAVVDAVHEAPDQVAIACSILKDEMVEPPEARELARRVGMNHNKLVAAFRDRLGHTPFSYLRELRLKRAQDLLMTRQCNVTEAAFQVGFTNPSSFSRAFREQFGMTPKSWVKSRAA